MTNYQLGPDKKSVNGVAIKLYEVVTTVPQYCGRKNVAFCWFNAEPDHCANPRPYAALIEGYEPKAEESRYSEQVVDELFSEDEARALRLGSTIGTIIMRQSSPKRSYRCRLT